MYIKLSLVEYGKEAQISSYVRYTDILRIQIGVPAKYHVETFVQP